MQRTGLSISCVTVDWLLQRFLLKSSQYTQDQCGIEDFRTLQTAAAAMCSFHTDPCGTTWRTCSEQIDRCNILKKINFFICRIPKLFTLLSQNSHPGTVVDTFIIFEIWLYAISRHQQSTFFRLKHHISTRTCP